MHRRARSARCQSPQWRTTRRPWSIAVTFHPPSAAGTTCTSPAWSSWSGAGRSIGWSGTGVSVLMTAMAHHLCHDDRSENQALPDIPPRVGCVVFRRQRKIARLCGRCRRPERLNFRGTRGAMFATDSGADEAKTGRAQSFAPTARNSPRGVALGSKMTRLVCSCPLDLGSRDVARRLQPNMSGPHVKVVRVERSGKGGKS